MGRNQTTCKVIPALFAALLASGAMAEPYTPPQPFVLKGKYTVAFNGITIGRIRLTVEETASKYSITVDTKTHGVGTLFSQEKRIAIASGAIRNGLHIPTKFESMPQKDPDGNRTEITYDGKGNAAKVVRVPEDDPSWRPVVPVADAKGALDPASGGLHLRRKLHAAIADGGRQVEARTFDGSRLATMTLTVIKPAARVQIMDSYVPAINTLVTRQPISGYTPKELKKFNAGDPEIHLYFTADDAFIPVLVTVNTLFGQLSATFSEKE